jgi:hypothetical protein
MQTRVLINAINSRMMDSQQENGGWEHY